MGVCVSSSAALGVDPDAKEAMCFALLGHQAVRGEATSGPRATGARQPAVLGKICHVPETAHTHNLMTSVHHTT